MADNDISDIARNYQTIHNNLVGAYKKLHNKLRSNGLSIQTIDKSSFTNLIHNINRIPAIEYYYPSNIQPSDDIILVASEGTPCNEYNALLAQKLNFYMRLIGYYLALKGVPIPDINDALTLNARIDLIDSIDKILLAIFVISFPTKVYYGRPIRLNYVLKDLNDNEINGGIITVYYRNQDTILRRINVGQPLIIQPPDVGQSTFYFEFSGSPRHKSTRVVKSINVLDPNAIDMLFIDNGEDIIDSNGDLWFEYVDISPDDNVDVIVDMSIIIDENDDAILCYETENIYADFNQMNEGLIDIELYRDDLYCEFVTVITLDN